MDFEASLKTTGLLNNLIVLKLDFCQKTGVVLKLKQQKDNFARIFKKDRLISVR
jgi:hypothetical protein